MRSNERDVGLFLHDFLMEYVFDFDELKKGEVTKKRMVNTQEPDAFNKSNLYFNMTGFTLAQSGL